MRKGKLVVLVSLVFVICVFLFSFSNEGSAEEREVVIGSASDLSGPWAPSGIGIANGRRAYARYVNEKLGGIQGVKVKVVVVDTAYNVDREIAAYKRFRDEDNALFMINQNTGATYAIERMMEESGKGMAHGHTGDPSSVFRGPGSWCFGTWMSPDVAGSALMRWWLNNRWKKTEKPKVALVNSDVSIGILQAVFLRDYCKRNGYPIVSDLLVPPRPVDTTSFVLNIKEGKADVVAGVQTDSGWTVMIRDTKRYTLGIPITTTCCLDEGALKVLGDAAIGVIITYSVPVWNDVDNPGVKLVHSLYKEWYPGEARKENYAFFWGWSQSAIAVEAIKRAMNKVGYDGLTKDIEKGRKVVRDVMENEMRGFDCGGMIPPLIYTPNDHRSCDSIRVYEVAPGGEFKFLGMGKADPLPPELITVKWWEDAVKGAAKK